MENDKKRRTLLNYESSNFSVFIPVHFGWFRFFGDPESLSAIWYIGMKTISVIQWLLRIWQFNSRWPRNGNISKARTSS